MDSKEQELTLMIEKVRETEKSKLKMQTETREYQLQSNSFTDERLKFE